jgi:hypothetical protein
MGGRYSCHICFIPRVSTHGSEFLLPTRDNLAIAVPSPPA